MDKMVHNNSKLIKTEVLSHNQAFATVDYMLLQLKQMDDKFRLIVKDRIVQINSSVK
jgi:hypothetical protein